MGVGALAGQQKAIFIEYKNRVYKVILLFLLGLLNFLKISFCEKIIFSRSATNVELQDLIRSATDTIK